MVRVRGHCLSSRCCCNNIASLLLLSHLGIRRHMTMSWKFQEQKVKPSVMPGIQEELRMYFVKTVVPSVHL